MLTHPTHPIFSVLLMIVVFFFFFFFLGVYVHAEKNVICYDHARSDLHEREYIQNS